MCSFPSKLWATLLSLNCTKAKCLKGEGIYTSVTWPTKITIYYKIDCHDYTKGFKVIFQIFFRKILRDSSNKYLAATLIFLSSIFSVLAFWNLYITPAPIYHVSLQQDLRTWHFESMLSWVLNAPFSQLLYQQI